MLQSGVGQDNIFLRMRDRILWERDWKIRPAQVSTLQYFYLICITWNSLLVSYKFCGADSKNSGLLYNLPVAHCNTITKFPNLNTFNSSNSPHFMLTSGYLDIFWAQRMMKKEFGHNYFQTKAMMLFYGVRSRWLMSVFWFKMRFCRKNVICQTVGWWLFFLLCSQTIRSLKEEHSHAIQMKFYIVHLASLYLQSDAFFWMGPHLFSCIKERGGALVWVGGPKLEMTTWAVFQMIKKYIYGEEVWTEQKNNHFLVQFFF